MVSENVRGGANSSQAMCLCSQTQRCQAKKEGRCISISLNLVFSIEGNVFDGSTFGLSVC